MKEYKFTPETTNSEGKPAWEGSLTIALPKHAERLKLAGELSYKAKSEDNKIDLAIMVSDLVRSKIKQIDLKHVESGIKIQDVEDLEYFDVQDLFNEIQVKLMGGIPLGKRSSKT